MFRRLNYLIIGVLAGLLLAGSLAFAQPLNEYILKQVTYPIIVDGQKYENDELPILNYNGTTYVPLKEVSNLLGADVSWDEVSKAVVINAITDNNTVKTKTSEPTFFTKDGIRYIVINGKEYACWGDLAWEYPNNKVESLDDIKPDGVNIIVYGELIYIDFDYFMDNLR